MIYKDNVTGETLTLLYGDSLCVYDGQLAKRKPKWVTVDEETKNGKKLLNSLRRRGILRKLFRMAMAETRRRSI